LDKDRLVRQLRQRRGVGTVDAKSRLRLVGHAWHGSNHLGVLPFVISQLCAAVVLRRVHGRMRQTDGLTDRIADAVKGLPPDKQEEIAKRMIDDALK
jgi:hypothetical protein